MKKISYVLPVYNEGESIDRFYTDLRRALAKVRDRYTFELIFVDDGSRDDSLERMKAIHAADPDVKVVSFSRNFGHQIAITAGIDLSTGDATIVMDTDLQDPPEVSLELIERWEQGYDVVYAQRRTRGDTFFKRWTAHAYYRLLNRLSDVEIPRDTGDFRLMDAQVTAELRRFREKNRFVRGLVASLGFRQTAVAFDRPNRFAGKTNYPLKKMVKLAYDGVTSFSTQPLQLITRLGFLAFLASVVGIAYALVVKIFFPEEAVSGWTMTIIVILLMGGIQMLTLGIVGTYVGRIYSEVQQRPLYIVSEVLQHGGEAVGHPASAATQTAARPMSRTD
ncbi:MAG TPA: glycosyltransferase family 2 protein [Actinomycetota bacterium]|nr:glycosyltransferase family 2 protein [Actinomycetota bacterium]